MDRRVDGSEVPTRQPGDIRTLKFTSSDTVSLQDFPSLVKGESLHLLSSWLWGLGWLVNVKLLDQCPERVSRIMSSSHFELNCYEYALFKEKNLSV